MTRRHDGGRSRLEAAKVAYLARFGEDAPVSPYLDHRRLPDVIFEAVERGEPLTDATLAEQLGPGASDRPAARYNGTE